MAPMDAIWLFLVLTQPLPPTTRLSHALPPYRSAIVVLHGYAISKNYLKYRAIQLAMLSIVGK